MKPIPYLLTAYGMPHRMGYLPTQAGEYHSTPLSPIEMMNSAAEFGLAGVEIPFRPKTDPPLEMIRDALLERDLKIVTDTMVVLEADATQWRKLLEDSKFLGAKVVRTLLSGILCGDRRNFPGGWEAHLANCAARLRNILPIAADLDLCLAVENHQDATTEDLLRLHEMLQFHPNFGVVLDTGNPLSVGQDPIEAALKLSHLIRHLHLKDYTIHFAPEGYRLVRCANGDGVIDFPAILEIVRKNEHELFPGIEIAAQATRTIPILEETWWSCFPMRDAKNLLPALRILWGSGKNKGEPYSSAWERGENSQLVSSEEWELVQKSVRHLHQIHID